MTVSATCIAKTDRLRWSAQAVRRWLMRRGFVIDIRGVAETWKLASSCAEGQMPRTAYCVVISQELVTFYRGHPTGWLKFAHVQLKRVRFDSTERILGLTLCAHHGRPVWTSPQS